MDARNFLKVQNFKIKEERYSFEDTKYMNATQKQKIYKGFIAFLNNHFKHTNFTKSIYEHCYMHCGFIAHYNINGFYGKYFSTAATFQKIAYDVEKNPSEYDGYYVGSIACEGKDSFNAKKAFYKIYEELTSSKEGLGDFYKAFSGRGGYFGACMNGDHGDLNTAICNAFKAYLQQWEDLITKAMSDYSAFSKDAEMKKLQEKQKEALAQAKALEKQAKEIEEELFVKATSTAIAKRQTTLLDFLVDVA